MVTRLIPFGRDLGISNHVQAMRVRVLDRVSAWGEVYTADDHGLIRCIDHFAVPSEVDFGFHHGGQGGDSLRCRPRGLYGEEEPGQEGDGSGVGDAVCMGEDHEYGGSFLWSYLRRKRDVCQAMETYEPVDGS